MIVEYFEVKSNTAKEFVLYSLQVYTEVHTYKI